ncbi:MAG: hypothetical protein ACR2PZ_09895 [Pseudomonadales bacterium]
MDKDTKLGINLPEKEKAQIVAAAKEQGFSTPSEYLVHLIEKDLKRNKKREGRRK